jgi:hypothetical protein
MLLKQKGNCFTGVLLYFLVNGDSYTVHCGGLLMLRGINSHTLPCRKFDPCDCHFVTRSHTLPGRQLEILCVLQLHNVQRHTHCKLPTVYGVVGLCRLRLKCDGARAETRLLLSAKWTSPFKSAGASVQSTTDSRSVRISGSNAGYTIFRGSVKGTGYSLHSSVSPSLPLPCVSMCHHVSTGLYLFFVISIALSCIAFFETRRCVTVYERACPKTLF